VTIAIVILEFLSALGKYLLSLPEQDAAKVMQSLSDQHLRATKAVADATTQTAADLAAAKTQLDEG